MCANEHEESLQELLARSVILDAIPCPNCVKHKQAPPYCFPRQKFVNLPDATSRSATIICPKCRQAWLRPLRVFPSLRRGIDGLTDSWDRAQGGRHYFIPFCDIFSPEVFISYNLGNYDRSRWTYSTNEVLLNDAPLATPPLPETSGRKNRHNACGKPHRFTCCSCCMSHWDATHTTCPLSRVMCASKASLC